MKFLSQYNSVKLADCMKIDILIVHIDGNNIIIDLYENASVRGYRITSINSDSKIMVEIGRVTLL